jgi:uncharacterized membrane protein
MNTVFKFYNQIWVLLALAAATLAVMMAREAFPRVVAAVRPGAPRTVGWSRLGVGVTLVVLLVSLAYPALATGPRLEQRFADPPAEGTLNALAWMATGEVPSFGGSGASEIEFAGDLAAIAWLQTHVSGTPVIAEASIGPYRCNGSRIASATGLPTIIGWERHEQQQRYPDTLPSRVEDVRTLYISSDVAEKTRILRRYNVAYVVVGALERVYPMANNECSPTGSAAGIEAFDAMVGSVLEVAFSSGDTTIYRVLPINAA